INQRLAALFTRAGQFAEAAACCRTLESIYHDAGCPGEAARYSQLAVKYEENLPTAPVPARAAAPAPAVVLQTRPPATPEFAVSNEVPGMPVEAGVPELAVTPEHADSAEAAPDESGPSLFFHAPRPPAAPEFSVPPAVASQAPEVTAEQLAAEQPEKEIDLSAEWEGALSEEPAPAAAPQEEAVAASPVEAQAAAPDPQAQTEIIEEIRFYLDHDMAEEARAAFVKLEQLKPEPY